MKHIKVATTRQSVLTITEVGDVLRVSRITAWRLVSTGKIRGFRAGKCWRVLSSSLDVYMEKGA